MDLILQTFYIPGMKIPKLMMPIFHQTAGILKELKLANLPLSLQ